MTYRRTLSALLTLLLLTSQAAAQTASRPSPVEAERLRRHVTYLASDKLEGRRTGTGGAEEAARYVAEEFARAGLAPGAENAATFQAGPTRADAKLKGYLQDFPYVAGVELGGGNALTATRRADLTGGTPFAVDFKPGEDWMPLGFGSNAKAEGPVVFAGYGITAAEQSYDDYKAADVRDKIALALAGTPDGDNPHSRFTRTGEPRFKAAAARAAGARALVLIASEERFADERLSRLRFDNSGGDAGIPVVVVSRQAAAKMLGLGGVDRLTAVETAARLLTTPAKVFEQGTDLGRPQPLNLSVTTDVARRNAPAANVVGVLEGSDPKLRDEAIVVGAHYDHLGRGGEGSLAAREGEVHHGADDNASGTAALIELARLLSQERARMRRTVVFVAFGGEEEGLIGSSFYVQHPARPVEQTVAMLNMDMIGRLREGALNVGGVGTSDVWRDVVARANASLDVKVVPAGAGGAAPSPSTARPAAMPVVRGADGNVVATAAPAERFNLRLSEDGYGPSDHSSFYSKRVPVLFFFTGSHEDYHKPSDTADRVNYDGEARIVEFVRGIIYELQAAERRPAFALAKSEGPTRSTGFRVYLGTIPTYGDSADGLKLEGVREGSPAQAAGLTAGDLIVKLAGRDVRNVYDYTQALSEMKAGQEYEVELMRAGQRLKLRITPAARK